MENAEYPFTSFNFRMQLTISNAAGFGLSDPLCNAEFSECDGLEMNMEPRTVREGGNNTQVTHLVGPVTYGNLSLKRGMTSNQDLWAWFVLATGNTTRGTAATAEIIMQDNAHNPKVRFVLTDCLPIKLKAPALNGKDGILAIEEMQIAYSTLTIALI